MNNQKQEEPKNELTLDDLARMVQDGFAQTASKDDLEKVNERVTGLDARITGLEKRMETGFQEITHILKPLNETVQEHTADIVDLQVRVRALEKSAPPRRHARAKK